MTVNQLQMAIAGIRPRFLAECDDRRVRLRALRPVLAAPGQLDAQLLELRYAAHKTAGIAGTLGFGRLGKSAQALDSALVTGGPSLARGPLPTEVMGLVDELIDELAQACAENPHEAAAQAGNKAGEVR